MDITLNYVVNTIIENGEEFTNLDYDYLILKLSK